MGTKFIELVDGVNRTSQPSTGQSSHSDGFFIQPPSLVQSPFRSSSTDGRRHSFLPTPVGFATSVDSLLPLRWTLTDPVRGRERETRTQSSEPPSWTQPLSSVSVTRPWQNGCSAQSRKVMRTKSLNRSVLSVLLFQTRFRPPVTLETNNPPTPIHR